MRHGDRVNARCDVLENVSAAFLLGWQPHRDCVAVVQRKSLRAGKQGDANLAFPGTDILYGDLTVRRRKSGWNRAITSAVSKNRPVAGTKEAEPRGCVLMVLMSFSGGPGWPGRGQSYAIRNRLAGAAVSGWQDDRLRADGLRLFCFSQQSPSVAPVERKRSDRTLKSDEAKVLRGFATAPHCLPMGR